MARGDTSAHYVNNAEFLAALVAHRDAVAAAAAAGQEKPETPNYIGECIMKIARHLAYKANFINYTFRDEMILDAIENCVIYMHNFDPAKSKNPFAYFTQISYFAFIRRIQKEKKAIATRNRYIESLDLTDIITQKGDDAPHANSFLSYLKKQIDTANKENAAAAAPPSPLQRKPMYRKTKKDPALAIEEPVVTDALFDDDDNILEA